MAKDDFILIIENALNINDVIRAENIVFSASFNRLDITIIYDDNKKDIFYKKKDEITKLITDYAGTDVDVNITYKKSFLDNNYLSVLIKKFITDNDLSLLKNISDNDIMVVKNDDLFSVEINVPLSNDFAKIYDSIFSGFAMELKSSYFYKFNIKLNYTGIVIEEPLDYQQDNYDIEYYHQKNEDEFVVVTDKTEFIGKIIEGDVIDFTKIVSKVDNVAICGQCYGFEKKEYQKENVDKESGLKTTVAKIRFSFRLKFKDSWFNCSYFPKKTDNTELSVEDGTMLCVDGMIDEFNGHLSMKVKNINFCTYVIEEKERRYFDIPKHYRTIFPEPFINDEQSDIFDLMSDKEPNPDLINKNYVVFDLETTGLDPTSQRIIEVSAIKITGGNMTECFNTLVNPEKKIPTEVVELTNITDEMVKDSPKDYEIIGDYLKFCEGCVLVAYNAPFDMSFLNIIAEKCNYKITNEVLDAYEMAKKKVKGVKNYKLKTVSEFMKVNLVGAHRAINDTLATAKVFVKLMNM